MSGIREGVVRCGGKSRKNADAIKQGRIDFTKSAQGASYDRLSQQRHPFNAADQVHQLLLRDVPHMLVEN